MNKPAKVKIANLPTPVQKLKFRDGEFLVKRDDYTGSEFSGNKIRKLEYILREAMDKGVKWLYSCGGGQSNHARAVAAAGAYLGFRTRLFLWEIGQSAKDGNLLLDEIYGAGIEYLSQKEYESVVEIMNRESEKIEEGVMAIPTGGSTPLGIWGYIDFIEELAAQIDINKLDGILCATGSGGTAAGMLLGSAMLGLDLKIYGVNVIGSGEEARNYILGLVNECKAVYNIDAEVNENNLEILDGYSEEGYTQTDPEKIELIKELARETGMLLDPVYTGKAFYAYNDQFLSKGKTGVLFLHTGGLFGVFPRKKDYLNY